MCFPYRFSTVHTVHEDLGKDHRSAERIRLHLHYVVIHTGVMDVGLPWWSYMFQRPTVDHPMMI